MQSWRDQEDDREILTNEDIKADLKKEVTSMLVGGAVIVLSLTLLILCFVQLLRALSEQTPMFWVCAILCFVLSFLGVWSVVETTGKAIVYLRAIWRNRFFVTADKLIDKSEGRKDPPARATLRWIFSPPKPNCYRFTGGTYKVSVKEPHYCRSKKFAMNGMTLFRRSNFGDSFLLVSLKPGKPVMIYPLDLFDYRDSSPL